MKTILITALIIILGLGALNSCDSKPQLNEWYDVSQNDSIQEYIMLLDNGQIYYYSSHEDRKSGYPDNHFISSKGIHLWE